MDDRKMLELAALAAGCKRMEYRDDVPYVSMGYPPTDDWMPWNPLTDDGDALELAVKLHLDVDCGRKRATVIWNNENGVAYQVEESHYGDDECAATRRAITRAAAAIGEQMEGE